MDPQAQIDWIVARRDLLGSLGVVAAAVCGWLLARRRGVGVGRRFQIASPPERLTPWLLAGLAFCLAALCAVLRPPEAAVHDEFSYLLAADTFAHGRLTNPTPPSPAHFETFHVIVEPTYASKYPPAQGLVLALGQVLFGHPVAGLWISAALFAAALWWALRARLSSGWSLVWSVLAIARFASSGYWAQSFWGGLVAATGGALALGGALRLARAVRPVDALALGVGSGVLALSRPFEGFALCAALHLFVAVRWWRDRSARPSVRVALRSVAPWAVALVVAVGFLARYNAAVTGDPLALPYQVHEDRYAAAPNFIVQSALERPTYEHPELERLWTGWTLAVWEHRHEAGVLAVLPEKIEHYGAFYVGWVWLPFLVVGLLAAGAGPGRWLLAVGLAALALESFDNEHYAAPFTAVVILVCASGASALANAPSIGLRSAARFAAAAVLVVTVAQSVVQLQAWRPTWPERRNELISDLTALDGRDVVFVRTDHSGLSPDERRHWENVDWVFGGADPLGAQVLFVRDLGTRRNTELLESLGPRRSWRLCLPAALANDRVLDALEPGP
ncbi:hypothetical protein Pla163_26970 [Planctomycetes bacterium Pla163]|uniref:Glycosyltransferase RgtA/B/C/D-like domain-containing protein n=1 Tax=Rohdeia mirabilis TaxID=2528008 RepID=A0A518D292_9BACT|nr:hypothetical protein Pla163_26970 [Planctomycetes bacterium Pla163]